MIRRWFATDFGRRKLRPLCLYFIFCICFVFYVESKLVARRWLATDCGSREERPPPPLRYYIFAWMVQSIWVLFSDRVHLSCIFGLRSFKLYFLRASYKCTFPSSYRLNLIPVWELDDVRWTKTNIMGVKIFRQLYMPPHLLARLLILELFEKVQSIWYNYTIAA